MTTIEFVELEGFKWGQNLNNWSSHKNQAAVEKVCSQYLYKVNTRGLKELPLYTQGFRLV